MQVVRRTCYFLLLILLLTGALTGAVALTGCSKGKAKTPGIIGKTPHDVVLESQAKMSEAKNYDVGLVIQKSTESFDTNLTGTANCFQNPLRVKVVMDSVTHFPGLGQEVRDTIELYMITADNIITLYQKSGVNPGWQKYTIDQDEAARILQLDPAAQTELFLKHLVEAKHEGFEVIGAQRTEKITLVASGELFKELAKDLDIPGFSNQIEALPSDILNKAGDLTYILWVDTDSLNMVKYVMDLTPFMKNLSQVMADSLPATQDAANGERPEMEAVYGNMVMYMECIIKNVNSAQDFKLPEETASARTVVRPL